MMKLLDNSYLIEPNVLENSWVRRYVLFGTFGFLHCDMRFVVPFHFHNKSIGLYTLLDNNRFHDWIW